MNNRGFTLLEVLISVLVSVAIVSFLSAFLLMSVQKFKYMTFDGDVVRTNAKIEEYIKQDYKRYPVQSIEVTPSPSLIFHLPNSESIVYKNQGSGFYRVYDNTGFSISRFKVNDIQMESKDDESTRSILKLEYSINEKAIYKQILLTK